MGLIRVGVLSDTHIPTRARSLPPLLFSALAGVDCILHAGDLTNIGVLGDLAAIAPVYAVYGNTDSFPVRQQLPYQRIVEIAGKRIGLIHGDGKGYNTPERAFRAFADSKVDAVVFGHSHQPYCELKGGCLLFNPGSPTDRRFQPRFSYGLLSIDQTGVHGTINYFGP